MEAVPMVAFSPPESPRKAARSREVDNLSLDDSDMNSIKMALNSVFEAAVELDSFLADERLSNNNDSNSIADDDSFASEERRLHESEVELRKALDLIESNMDDDDSKDETDSVDALGCERLDTFSAESYESPESQVPLLQPVSPFGSPFSESSKEESSTCLNPVFEAPSIARIHSPKGDSKKRQIRAYGLRPHVKEPFVDLEALEQIHSSTPKSIGYAAQVMANALFGRTEYTVHSFFSSEEYKRTVQGTMSVLLASGIVVADRAKHSPHMIFLMLLLPALIAATQARLPHRTDETIIAVVLLGAHVVMSHLSALHVI